MATFKPNPRVGVVEAVIDRVLNGVVVPMPTPVLVTPPLSPAIPKTLKMGLPASRAV